MYLEQIPHHPADDASIESYAMGVMTDMMKSATPNTVASLLSRIREQEAEIARLRVLVNRAYHGRPTRFCSQHSGTYPVDCTTCWPDLPALLNEHVKVNGTLLAERDRLQALNESLAERVAAQSELLSKRAERDGLVEALESTLKFIDRHYTEQQVDSETPPEPADAFSYECGSLVVLIREALEAAFVAARGPIDELTTNAVSLPQGATNG